MEHARSATTVKRVRTDLTPIVHLFIHMFQFLHLWMFQSEEKLTSCFLRFLILPLHFCVKYKPHLFLTSNLTCTFNRENVAGFEPFLCFYSQHDTSLKYFPRCEILGFIKSKTQPLYLSEFCQLLTRMSGPDDYEFVVTLNVFNQQFKQGCEVIQQI